MFACVTKETRGPVGDVPDLSKHDYRKTFRKQPPSKKFNRVLGWVHVVTKEFDSKKPASIVLKSMKIYNVTDESREKLVYSRLYDSPITTVEGGLYPRIPGWSEDKKPIFGSKMTKNGLFIDISKTPKSWVHWWSYRIPYRLGERYRIELVAKIDGNACMQIGSDYWRGDGSLPNGWDEDCVGTNSCEGSISQWFYDTGGKFGKFVSYTY